MNIEPYLRLMAQKNASDLYFTTGAPPSIKIEGQLKPISNKPLEPGMAKAAAYNLMNENQIMEFEAEKEMNLGISLKEVGRFRVNVYIQRGEPSMVIRYIKNVIPSIEQLNMPPVLKDLVLHNTGLIMVVGSTGSGKSTTMASMIDFRNQSTAGHILTVEDPIEYVFEHKQSIVGQREVGVDTLSYENALREAMREAPDMIMVGEVRDLHTLEACIGFADTGHLAMSTLHAVNSFQALERMINMFPAGAKHQVLMDLSLNLKAIVSQRLVPTKDGGRIPAVEILINTPYIAELIKNGEMGSMKEVMEKGASSGMQTFDQSLFELYKAGMIDLQAALAAADSRGDLEWRINFGGGVKAAKKEDVALEMPSESLDGDLNPMAAKAALEDAVEEKSEADKSLDDALGDLKPLDEVKLIEDE